MSHVFTLQKGTFVYGVYSSWELACRARERAAIMYETTVYDESFNITPHRIDWVSTTEKEMVATHARVSSQQSETKTN